MTRAGKPLTRYRQKTLTRAGKPLTGAGNADPHRQAAEPVRASR